MVDQVLRYAVRARYISLNPADDVALPRKNNPEKTTLTHDQVRQLADAAEELRTMVYVLGYGGLRYGEIAALRVGDVDASRRRLTVSRSVTAVARMGMVEGGTKTHQTRSVPLPESVMDLVVEQITAGRRMSWCSRTMTAVGYRATGLPSGLRRLAPQRG